MSFFFSPPLLVPLCGPQTWIYFFSEFAIKPVPTSEEEGRNPITIDMSLLCRASPIPHHPEEDIWVVWEPNWFATTGFSACGKILYQGKGEGKKKSHSILYPSGGFCTVSTTFERYPPFPSIKSRRSTKNTLAIAENSSRDRPSAESFALLINSIIYVKQGVIYMYSTCMLCYVSVKNPCGGNISTLTPWNPGPSLADKT